MDTEIRRRRVPGESASSPHVGVKFGSLVGVEMPPDVPFHEMPMRGLCVGDPEMYERVLARGRSMRHV